MAKLQGNDAAIVAAMLTQAEATIQAAIFASGAVEPRADFDTESWTQLTYNQHLAFARSHDPDPAGTGYDLGKMVE